MTTYTIDPTITKTKKVVININYGGFNVTKKMQDLYFKYKAEQGVIIDENNFNPYDSGELRHDPVLIRVIEELGVGRDLKIVEVRDQENWYYRIREYDGKEWLEEYYQTLDGKYKFTVKLR